jgi:hypothetical protein
MRIAGQEKKKMMTTLCQQREWTVDSLMIALGEEGR